jgi:hypothetical protein
MTLRSRLTAACALVDVSRPRKRRCLGAMALAAAFVAPACGGPAAGSLTTVDRDFAALIRPVVPPGFGIVWQKRGMWSGNGNRQTDPFPATAIGAFRFAWTTSAPFEPGEGAFKVMLHNAKSGAAVMELVDARGSDGTTAFVSAGPGSFYLVVDSKGVDWTIAVEETVPSN